MVVILSGFQNRGREGGLIRGIREELCFQTEGVVWTVGAAILSTATSADEICGVKMHSRQGGFCLHGDAGGGRVCLCGRPEDARSSIYDVVVIVSARVA